MVSADPSSADGATTPPAASGYRARWGLIAAMQHRVIQALASRLGLRIYGIFSRPVATPIGPPPIVAGFAWRLLAAGDEKVLLTAACHSDLGITESFVRQAFAKGDVCDAVLHDGKIVAFSWSAFTPTHDHDGVYVEFGDAYRYTYFAFTLPAFRGRHLPRLFTPCRDRLCIERGRTHCISYISIDNRASMRSFIASGNRRIGFAGYWLCGPIFVPFRTLDALRFYRP